jgi:hypothetical protein
MFSLAQLLALTQLASIATVECVARNGTFSPASVKLYGTCGPATIRPIAVSSREFFGRRPGVRGDLVTGRRPKTFTATQSCVAAMAASFDRPVSEAGGLGWASAVSAKRLGRRHEEEPVVGGGGATKTRHGLLHRSLQVVTRSVRWLDVTGCRHRNSLAGAAG